jgi:hypothetical protein
LRFFRLAWINKTEIGSKHSTHTAAMTYATVNKAASELSDSMY